MKKPLYGPQTALALQNFPISGWPMHGEFIAALALIKEHAAVVNGELKQIPKGSASAIARASREVKKGKHADQFMVDVFQTGSGTSSNMNVNEVVAKIAGKDVHPNDHVNCGQSSNDVVPSAIQIAVAIQVNEKLLPALDQLVETLRKKEDQFSEVLKSARTHLMDAVPITLGMEFGAFASLLEGAIERVEEANDRLYALPLGGTAAGTGMNAHRSFAKKVIMRIAKETKLPFAEADDHVAAQSCPLAMQAMSSALKEVAVVLNKIACDIRLMGSGPVSGFNEIRLPELQKGSSIMPGKVNPVLCESVEQVAAWVMGADVTVAQLVATASRFELHTGFPMISCKLLTSIELLSNVSELFAKKCVRGIKANTKKLRADLDRNAILVTNLAPLVGYEKAAEIATEAMKTGESILDVAHRQTGLSLQKLKTRLNPEKML